MSPIGLSRCFTFAAKFLTSMIFQKIFIAERQFKKDVNSNRDKLVALDSIKTLLEEIDHNAEIVPASDVNNLLSLLSDLKGSDLNEQEKKVAEEIVGI